METIAVKYTKTVLDFKVKRGDTFRNKIVFSTKTGNTISPDDITASDFKLRIATLPDGGVTIKELSIGSGLSFEDTNKLVLSIPAEEMTFAAGVYYYDVQRTYQDGTVVTRPEGRFIVESDVTV